MLWAIFRLQRSIKRIESVSAYFNQRMVVIHFITFAIYLCSLIIYYVFDYIYDTQVSNQGENNFYIARTISFVLLAQVEIVLVYIFWGLTTFYEKEQKEDCYEELV